MRGGKYVSETASQWFEKMKNRLNTVLMILILSGCATGNFRNENSAGLLAVCKSEEYLAQNGFLNRESVGTLDQIMVDPQERIIYRTLDGIDIEAILADRQGTFKNALRGWSYHRGDYVVLYETHPNILACVFVSSDFNRINLPHTACTSMAIQHRVNYAELDCD